MVYLPNVIFYQNMAILDHKKGVKTENSPYKNETSPSMRQCQYNNGTCQESDHFHSETCCLYVYIKVVSARNNHFFVMDSENADEFPDFSDFGSEYCPSSNNNSSGSEENDPATASSDDPLLQIQIRPDEQIAENPQLL
ncbi:unnamed protein product [Ceutorhynchus assimilis]|uniref:Uncharacterized protein n=1 Tax=Ceutorhynchus assimilis TaxID=467358 RepID=A0A9N9MZ04_9CUCU|nr:unnamed protein product [Ceutorhynchus assimilis]